MLAVVFGASCSGKSTLAALLRALLPDVAVHDFDEDGRSPPWDRAWRRSRTEDWLRAAVDERGRRRDLLLLGGVPGEVLASPSAIRLDGLTFCFLDCADDERVRRLRERGPVEPHPLWDHVAWGAWLRFHAADPAWFDGPLRGDGGGGLAWERIERWAAGDLRWRIERVDTTRARPDESAAAVASWLRERQGERDAGVLPLSGRWWDGATTKAGS
jgi:energy-coupling factor transporter ATP-binding protein EcfA2